MRAERASRANDGHQLELVYFILFYFGLLGLNSPRLIPLTDKVLRLHRGCETYNQED